MYGMTPGRQTSPGRLSASNWGASRHSLAPLGYPRGMTRRHSTGPPALLMIGGRGRSIPSPSQPISNHVSGASRCFRSSCRALPMGVASSAPRSRSRTSPSLWQPPLPRRLVPFAATTHPACAAATPAGSTTCPLSAGACGFRSPSAASSAHGPNSHDISLPIASRALPRLGHGPLTGYGRPRRTSAPRWAAPITGTVSRRLFGTMTWSPASSPTRLAETS